MSNAVKILYKFPSRSRPSKFFACLDNIQALSRHNDFEILASFDLDDSTMANPEVRDRLKQYPKVKAYYGSCNTKVEAINKDMVFAGPWDILVVWSDDMVAIKEGFDLDIINGFQDFSGLLHFPDGFANERLCTLPIMDRNYFDIDNWIYHPDFLSVYCDNFQQDLAKRRGRYKFNGQRIVTHQHSMWGFGRHDALVLRNENRENYEKDRLTWQRLLNDPQYV